MTTSKHFPEQHGYGPEDVPTVIRTDAPWEVREVLLALAEGGFGIRPSYLRSVLCAASKKLADPANCNDCLTIWAECRSLIDNAPWCRVYYLVELLYERLANSPEPAQASRWQHPVNEYFIEAGVG